MKTFWTIFGLVMAVIIVGVIIFSKNGTAMPSKYDEFAQCLTGKGAIFYGAFWCPHCAEQKALFGKSLQKIKYVECSNPDRSMNQACINAGVESYPTWLIPGEDKLEGVQSLADLASTTDCVLPE